MIILDIVLLAIVAIVVLVGLLLFVFWLLAFLGIHWWTAIVPGSDIAIVGRGEHLHRVITPEGWVYDTENDEIISIEDFSERYPGKRPRKPFMDRILHPVGVSWVSWLFPALHLLLHKITRRRIKTSGVPSNSPTVDDFIETDREPLITPFFHLFVEFPVVLKDVRTSNQFDLEILLRVLCRVVKPKRALIMLRDKATERVASAIAGYANDMISRDYDYQTWNKEDTGKGSKFSGKFLFLNREASPSVIDDAGLEICEVWVEVWKDGPTSKGAKEETQKQQRELLLAQAETAKQLELKNAKLHQATGDEHLLKIDPAIVTAKTLMKELGDPALAAMVAVAAAQRDAAQGSRATVYSPGGSAMPMVQIPLPAQQTTASATKGKPKKAKDEDPKPDDSNATPP